MAISVHSPPPTSTPPTKHLQGHASPSCISSPSHRNSLSLHASPYLSRPRSSPLKRRLPLTTLITATPPSHRATSHSMRCTASIFCTTVDDGQQNKVSGWIDKASVVSRQARIRYAFELHCTTIQLSTTPPKRFLHVSTDSPCHGTLVMPNVISSTAPLVPSPLGIDRGYRNRRHWRKKDSSSLNLTSKSTAINPPPLHAV
ncbi:hypothetical protein EX30DRAFT_254305 [Ascodesmis nigricans]|uniref:Uncharacterized protein n=1 Tax=Ascodesmis nigricans TaxID=341454 RepID=A0A4S2MY98_9PEZI|nr:hypothetical protein EX30DRAFT_254305 [Ascodesmis nigricans]